MFRKMTEHSTCKATRAFCCLFLQLVPKFFNCHLFCSVESRSEFNVDLESKILLAAFRRLFSRQFSSHCVISHKDPSTFLSTTQKIRANEQCHTSQLFFSLGEF